MTELEVLINIASLLEDLTAVQTIEPMSSTQAAALIDSVNYYGSLGCGLIMALIFATTWKG